MADKGKKPFVTPGGAKNIAAAKAAWAGGAPTSSNTSTGSITLKKPEEKKENEPVVDHKAKAGAVASTKPGALSAKAAPGTAAKAAPAAKEPVKEEPPKPAPVAPTKPLHTNTNSRKHDSDESSEESSSEEDSDDESAGSDASDDSERRKKKAKKIDVGVSLSSIKAAFQQDNQARQQVKKLYDAEEFKREVKEAALDATAENEPEKSSSDVRSAVQSDLGLDALKSASVKETKSRFLKAGAGENGKEHEENDELKMLKERSAVSGTNSKWEKPEEFAEKEKEPREAEPDIEVAACKARKMKEKFEKKVRKEEKKNKTPKPKTRTSVQADHHE